MFNFTAEMERLIHHVITVHPDFKHVRHEHIVISFSQTRTPGIHGVYASCQPMRFKDGEKTKKHRGRTFAMPQLIVNEKEIFYVLSFALPRFMNLDFDTKMTTVIHELYHISPKFNGDIRRFKGKNYAHGHSRKVYNERMKKMADEYMAVPGAHEYTEFLRKSTDQLLEEYGKIVGTRVRVPRPRVVT